MNPVKNNLFSWVVILAVSTGFLKPLVAQSNTNPYIALVSSNNLPQVTYAAIDISGSVQGTNNITDFALADDNTAYFLYTSVTPDWNTITNSLSATGAFGMNIVQKWQSGTLSLIQTNPVVQVTPGVSYGDSSYYDIQNYINKTYVINPTSLLTNGALYGTLANTILSYNSDGSFYASQGGDFVGLLGTGSFGLPFPYDGGPLDVGSTGMMVTAANSTGWCCGWGVFGFVHNGTNAIYNPSIPHTNFINQDGIWDSGMFYYIYNGTNFTIFDPNTSWDEVSSSGNITVNTNNFEPSDVNRVGSVIGYTSTVNTTNSTTNNAPSFWSGGNLFQFNTNVDIDGFNDQNQLILSCYPPGWYWDSPSQGYLWENSGNTNQLLMTNLPPMIESQHQGIYPYQISNQRNPAGAGITNPDTSINILATSWYPGNGGNLLFQRNNSNHITVYQQQFPTNVAGLDIQSINSQGLIAALGTPAGSNNTHAYLMVPVELAVDANRDGTIVMVSDGNNPNNIDANGNRLPQDSTTQDRPYRFWLNNDNDSGEQDNPGSSTKDSDSSTIVSQRDLEDFSRLWLHFGGLQDAIAAGTIQVGLEWRNVTGSPSIKVFQAAEPSGGDQYLRTTLWAGNQQTGAFGTALGTISGSGGLVFPTSFWQSNLMGLSALSVAQPNRYLLFEGVSEGKGQLVLTFWQNGQKIGEGGSVWIDLHDIKEMYERAIASPSPAIPGGVATPTSPNITEAPDTTGGVFVPDPNESSPHTYVVFVHGFNTTYAQSTSAAETVFKRMFWRGYKGRFASFRWPIPDTWFNGWNGAIPAGAVGTYNDQEYIAWHSGTALKKFVQSLPHGYVVDIAAHSMGNIVTGEALREGMIVNRYAMLHAASSASCYSNGNYTFPTTTSSLVPSPDNDTDSNTRGLTYTGWLGGIGGSPKNFYDINDSVVGWIWNANNFAFKPQPLLTGAYTYLSSNPPGHKLFYLNNIGLIRYLTDQGEIKAYDDYSLTGAIGSIATSSNGSITTSNPDNSFGDEHSSEWGRNIQDSQILPFYNNLMGYYLLAPNP